MQAEGCKQKDASRRMKVEDPMNNNYEDLRERTKAFALRIITMFAALPQTTQAQIIGKQVLRSGTSIGANYREAYRARSTAEFLAKLGDCLKEAEETAYWLELLVEADIVSAVRLHELQNETNQLIAIFVASIKRTKGIHEDNEQYFVVDNDSVA
jgi:four helix bundle protein